MSVKGYLLQRGCSSNGYILQLHRPFLSIDIFIILTDVYLRPNYRWLLQPFMGFLCNDCGLFQMFATIWILSVHKTIFSSNTRSEMYSSVINKSLKNVCRLGFLACINSDGVYKFWYSFHWMIGIFFIQNDGCLPWYEYKWVRHMISP